MRWGIFDITPAMSSLNYRAGTGLLLFLVGAASVSAQTQFRQWNRPGQRATWEADEHWFPEGAPGGPGLVSWDVTIDNSQFSNSTVDLVGGASIARLNLQTGDRLVIQPGATLAVTRREGFGVIENQGTFRPPLDSDASDEFRYLAGSILNAGTILHDGPGTWYWDAFDTILEPVSIAQEVDGLMLVDGADARLSLEVEEVLGGTIRVTDTAQVELRGGRFSGVIFEATTGGVFSDFNTPREIRLHDIGIAPGTTVTVGARTTIEAAAAWEGTLRHDGGNDVTFVDGGLVFDLLAGVLEMGNFRELRFPQSDTVLIHPDFSVEGAFSLGNGSLKIINDGTLRAAGGLVRVRPTTTPPMENEGTLSAAGAGRLLVHDGAIDHAGVILAEDQAEIEIPFLGGTGVAIRADQIPGQPGVFTTTGQGKITLLGSTTVSGGEFETFDQSQIVLLNSTRLTRPTIAGGQDGMVVANTGFPGPYPTLAEATIDGTGHVHINTSRYLNLEGATLVNGVLSVATAGELRVHSDVVLDGTGGIRLAGSARLVPGTIGDAIVLPEFMNLSGAGFIRNATFTNQGVVLAEGGSLTLQPAEAPVLVWPVLNEGTMRATAGGTLVFDRRLVGNFGLIEAVEGGTVLVEFSGTAAPPPLLDNESGSLAARGIGSTVRITSGALDGGTLHIEDGATGEFAGGQVDRLDVQVGGDPFGFSFLDLIGSTTYDATVVQLLAGAEMEVQSGTHDGVEVHNQQGMLTLASGVLENATIQVGLGETFYEQTEVRNTDFVAEPGLAGGAMPTPILADVPNINGRFFDVGLGDDVTMVLRSGYYFRVGGTFEVNGEVDIDGTIPVATGILAEDGLVISGAGRLRLRGPSSFIWGSGPIDFTIGPNVTLQGGPALGLPAPNAADIRNEGTIIFDDAASGGAIYPRTRFQNIGRFEMTPGRYTPVFGRFENSGEVEVGATTDFRVMGVYHQSAGRVTLNGTLNAEGGATFIGGEIAGMGFLTDVNSGLGLAVGAARISPGVANTRELAFIGTTTLQATTEIDLEIGGLVGGVDHDRLAVNGVLNLGGVTLKISLVNGFVPQPNQTFTLVESYVSMNGVIGNLGRIATEGGEGTFEVRQIGNSLVALSFDDGAVFVDSDRDGLADAWELEHFDNLDRDGLGDADGDGISDLLEFFLATDPNVPNGLPIIAEIREHEGARHLFVRLPRREQMGDTQVDFRIASGSFEFVTMTENFLLENTTPTEEAGVSLMEYRFNVPVSELGSEILVQVQLTRDGGD